MLEVRQMTGRFATGGKGIMIFAAAMFAVWAGMIPASSDEILLYSQQPYNLSANRTLVAEDVDPHSGVVWLKLYSGNEALKSDVLSVGGRFGYIGYNLTVRKIYAGGDRDLVELEIDYNNSSSAVNATRPNVSLNITDMLGNASSNSSVPLRTLEKSPATGAWAVLSAALARMLIKMR
jgi:hypothetical protein